MSHTHSLQRLGGLVKVYREFFVQISLILEVYFLNYDVDRDGKFQQYQRRLFRQFILFLQFNISPSFHSY